MTIHYPALEQFFGGYFHQDWDLDYPDADAAVAEFLATDVHHHPSFRSELETMLRQTADEQLEPLMTSLGASWVPSADGRDARRWLTDLLGATSTQA